MSKRDGHLKDKDDELHEGLLRDGLQMGSFEEGLKLAFDGGTDETFDNVLI